MSKIKYFFIASFISLLIIVDAYAAGPLQIDSDYIVTDTLVVYNLPMYWNSWTLYGIDGGGNENLGLLDIQSHADNGGDYYVETDASIWSGGLQTSVLLLGGDVSADEYYSGVNYSPNYILKSDLHMWENVVIELGYVYDIGSYNALDSSVLASVTVVYGIQSPLDNSFLEITRQSFTYNSSLNAQNEYIGGTFVIPQSATCFYFLFELDFISTVDPASLSLDFTSFKLQYDNGTPSDGSSSVGDLVTNDQDRYNDASSLKDNVNDILDSYEGLQSDLDFDKIDISDIDGFDPKDNVDPVALDSYAAYLQYIISPPTIDSSGQLYPYSKSALITKVFSISGVLGLLSYILFGKR